MSYHTESWPFIGQTPGHCIPVVSLYLPLVALWTQCRHLCLRPLLAMMLNLPARYARRLRSRLLVHHQLISLSQTVLPGRTLEAVTHRVASLHHDRLVHRIISVPKLRLYRIFTIASN